MTFSQTHINLHDAAAEVLRAFQKHSVNVAYCKKAIANPEQYRFYTPNEYQAMLDDSMNELTNIKEAYFGMMKRMVSSIVNFDDVEILELVND